MANYYSTMRSSYFKVKDQEKFEDFVNELCAGEEGLDVVERNEDEGKYFAIVGSVLPFFSFNGIGDYDIPEGKTAKEYEDELVFREDNFDLPAELAPHLADGETVILTEVGNEKTRYVSYTNLAINSDGESTWETPSSFIASLKNNGWKIPKRLDF